MNTLFITTKDRPTELTILCKSLLHSDMHEHIREVIFLDDNSEDIVSLDRIFSAFSYAALRRGVKARMVHAKDGRSGINESLDRIKHYFTPHIFILNGDMMVFPRYFAENMRVYKGAKKKFKGESIFVSGFNTTFHPPIARIPELNAIQTRTFGGCSCLTEWENLDKILNALGKPTMSRGWDLHIGEVFDRPIVCNPTQCQHLGFLTGLNQVSLAGFPGAFAHIGEAQ
jgi:hypothetical protein